MMKGHGITAARAYLESLDERDVMEESMKAVLEYLESHNMKGDAMPEYGLIELKFGGGSYPLTMKIEFDADRETASASVIMPATCVKEKRTTLAELLHRINFVMVLGEWKLDPMDGECLMKYTHFIGDTPMSLKQAERMVDICLVTAHMHQSTIMPLMMGNEPDKEEACSEYQEMTGDDDSISSFRQLLMKAMEARRKEEMVQIEGAHADTE